MMALGWKKQRPGLYFIEYHPRQKNRESKESRTGPESQMP